MTVATQIKQTLASLKGARAMMGTYAEHHPDKKVEHDFKNSEQQCQKIINDLEGRIKILEFEEPQYKGN